MNPAQLRREKREYIYRRTIEQTTQRIHDDKKQVKRSLDENVEIPNHLQEKALKIQKSLKWDDEAGEGVTTNCDDEYQWVGEKDPQIVITTSRHPSDRLKKFVKEMKLVLPNSQRINRGGNTIERLMAACRGINATDLVIFSEFRGNPCGMEVCHLPFGPTARFNLKNVTMRHEIPNIGTMSQAYPNLVFDNFESKVGKRVMTILKSLFPVPKEDSCRVIGFVNINDEITFMHKKITKVDKKTELEEIGPRFDMQLYDINLGTLESGKAAETEFVLKPFKNSSKNKRTLSNMPSILERNADK